MVLVCGPRLDPASIEAPPGVEVRGYVPQLYEHFAACDLAVVQGGGTTTLELTVLRRPFLYFPLENRFEQNLVVAERVARHRAGKRMSYSQTTPERLADAIFGLIGHRRGLAGDPYRRRAPGGRADLGDGAHASAGAETAL